MDRLHGNSQRVCVLCNGHDENHDHLFFGCSFSSSIWLDISSRAQIGWKAGNWSQAWQDIAVRCSNKNNPRHRLVGLTLASSIYHIWKERNNRIFDQHFSNSQKIRDEIVNSVCGKMGGLGVGDMWALLEMVSLVSSFGLGPGSLLGCSDGAVVGPLWARGRLSSLAARAVGLFFFGWAFFFGLRSVCWVLGLGGLGSRFGCSSSCGLTACSFEFLWASSSVLVVVKAAGGS
ncbi:hypothetical protein OIU84_017724 [Salix udensis]|uniref:Reverse transcriptase zinc-binding domain-containing protein n=1 Tax=Salix udensis TaxID=889485 RepID=A0AAD6L2H7_9ROSI|nr:hypothetical protein OIU84_017724 [Salix udensis]